MKFKPEEFIVEEITSENKVLKVDTQIEKEGIDVQRDYFTQFVLQKTKWTTNDALYALARRIHVKRTRFDYAGNKDRNAITTQLCSAFCVEPKALLNARLKDVEILGAWKTNEKIKLGNLKGNRFTITLTNENTGKRINLEEIRERASKGKYPNYFGEQRFGSIRKNTALVGELLLKNDVKSAVMNYLTFTEGETSEEALIARERLGKEGDFKTASEYYPQWLKNEQRMLHSLVEYENDYGRAFRTLPRTLQLLFVHAVQSRLFNDELADDPHGEEGNLVGHNTLELTEFEIKWLKKHDLTKESFKIQSFPELSAKGSKRKWFAELHDFKIIQEEPTIIRFSLDAGHYATQAIRYLIDLPSN